MGQVDELYQRMKAINLNAFFKGWAREVEPLLRRILLFPGDLKINNIPVFLFSLVLLNEFLFLFSVPSFFNCQIFLFSYLKTKNKKQDTFFFPPHFSLSYSLVSILLSFAGCHFGTTVTLLHLLVWIYLDRNICSFYYPHHIPTTIVVYPHCYTAFSSIPLFLDFILSRHMAYPSLFTQLVLKNKPHLLYVFHQQQCIRINRLQQIKQLLHQLSVKCTWWG